MFSKGFKLQRIILLSSGVINYVWKIDKYYDLSLEI